MKRNFKISRLICLCFIIIMMPQILKAQRKPINLPSYDNELYHYGFILGYNQMLFTRDYINNFESVVHPGSELPASEIYAGTGINPNYDFLVTDITTHLTHGFTVGIVGNLRLAKYFDLRLIPSLSFGERSITYRVTQEYPSSIDTTMINIDAKINSVTHSTFVELPLQIKYRSKRYNNSAAYIITGLNYKIDMASNKKKYGETDGRPKSIGIKRHDLAAEVGAGFDFYTGYFKLGVEIKMSYGLLNVAKNDNFLFTNSFDSLRNKTFQLSFTFE